MQLQQANAEAVDGPDINSILQQVFLGNQQIVSHVGVSQFQTSDNAGIGRSACGLAALNCARTVFGKEDSGIKGEELLHEVLTRETAEVNTSSLLVMVTSHLNGSLPLCRKSLQFVCIGTVRSIWTWKTSLVYRGLASHCLWSNNRRTILGVTSPVS